MSGEAASCVLITGAARGLGQALAERYGAAGWQVLAPSRAELDVADEASIAAYGRGLGAQPVDILYNNAGVRLIEGASKLGEFSQAMWLTTLTINTVGPVLVTQALLPNLRLGRRRKVVSMSSRLGSLTDGGGANSGGSDASYYAYRASKTALNQINRCLASDLAGEGFACVVLSPGWVRTAMGGANANDTPEDVARDIVALVDRIGPAQNGAFLDRKGQMMPW